jgi:tRNA U34 5-methylaminomethyl-2-thiouridine-forming methyltransferase MnmC
VSGVFLLEQNRRMEHELIITSDGSHSILVKQWNEQYHSLHGAVQESKHVYINAGLNEFANFKNEALHILEIGLGTGLNALLTLLEFQKNKAKILYTAIEAFPLELDVVKQLNYSKIIDNEASQEYFIKIHTCNWNEKVEIVPGFVLEKMNTKLENLKLSEQYNLIYFDAFAPRVQPELWTEEVFRKLYNLMLPGGILVTYCAKGEVKRTLKKVGFVVETLQGPPGKREMVRAAKYSHV